MNNIWLHHRHKILWGICLFLFVVGAFYYYTHQDEIAKTHQLESSSVSQVPILLKVADKVLQLDPISKSVNCQVNGPLPDHACTPGAVFAEASKEIICVQGYTKTVRSVSSSIKKKVYKEYSISYPQPFGSYEADHLIPLELGGNNDIANLFPEAASPFPGFKEKDLVENYLHNEMCAGNISLSVAQEQIANDWLAVYNALTPEQIAILKAQSKSWAH